MNPANQGLIPHQWTLRGYSNPRAASHDNKRAREQLWKTSVAYFRKPVPTSFNFTEKENKTNQADRAELKIPSIKAQQRYLNSWRKKSQSLNSNKKKRHAFQHFEVGLVEDVWSMQKISGLVSAKPAPAAFTATKISECKFSDFNSPLCVGKSHEARQNTFLTSHSSIKQGLVSQLQPSSSKAKLTSATCAQGHSKDNNHFNLARPPVNATLKTFDIQPFKLSAGKQSLNSALSQLEHRQDPSAKAKQLTSFYNCFQQGSMQQSHGPTSTTQLPSSSK